MKVRTLLQNIEVLSAGKNFQRDNEGKPVEVQVVNLLVTPEQAELLKARRLSGALIGVAGAIGALGGLFINLAFRSSFSSFGSGDLGGGDVLS